MASLSREELLSLSGWRGGEVQHSASLWPQRLSLANCSSGFPDSVFFSSGCVSCWRPGYPERACGENCVDQNVASVLFCPHLHVLWPYNPLSQSDVPWGPSALKGDSHNPIHLEMDLMTSVFWSLAMPRGAVGTKLPLCAILRKIFTFHRVARTNAPFPRVWSQISWVSLHWHVVFNCCM